jgi:hypothetical protein
MSEKSYSHKCNICNKFYASSNSLWNHNKKFHENDTTPVISQSSANDKPDISQRYKCKYCNQDYKHFQSRWKHEKKCKITQDNNNKIKQLELEIEQLKNTKSNTNNKIINTNNNTNTNSHNNTNNGTVNNITINKFGSENVSILTAKEIKQLIKNNNCLVEIIKTLNFNKKYPQYHSFCNTSLEGKYISVLNSDNNKIEKINKNDFYDKVLTNSFDKMEHISFDLEFDKELKSKIKEKYKEHLDNKLTNYMDIFQQDKIYKKTYKTNINELSYNNKKLILDTWSSIPEIENEESDSDDFSESESSVKIKHSKYNFDDDSLSI